jgi:hypothetical protein
MMLVAIRLRYDPLAYRGQERRLVRIEKPELRHVLDAIEHDFARLGIPKFALVERVIPRIIPRLRKGSERCTGFRIDRTGIVVRAP